jgi:Tfp pilus assembly protein PilV
VKTTRSRRGFSLVEVVIALGVTGFAITAVIGLMSVALNSSRSAQDETLIATMSSSLAGELRTGAFTNAKARLAAAPVVYFTGEGRLTAPLGESHTEATALQKGALYRCDLSLVPEPSTRTGTNAGLLHRMVMTFSWPVGSPRETRSIHASLLQD